MEFENTTYAKRIEMTRRSTGILLFRRIHDSAQVLLVHPGGRYWRRKDEGAWSIPKGLFDEGEESLSAAKREFLEETGVMPKDAFIELGEFRQTSGKRLTVWALERDLDPASFKSNKFQMRGRRSLLVSNNSQRRTARNGSIGYATRKITRSQQPILDAFLQLLGSKEYSRT